MSYTESSPTSQFTLRGVAVEARTLAGLAFIALAAQFMTAIMLAAAMVSGYDFQGAAISDLGVFPETALLFNLSLIAVGILNLIGGYAFFRLHGKGWLLVVFALASIGAIGAGLFPLDTGGLHSLAAVLAFVFFNVEAIGSASVLTGAMRALSVVAGAIGLVFIGLMVIGDAGTAAAFGPIGHGGTERMIIYPAMIWLIALGGALLGADDTGDSRPA